jgi:hypothetical protein
MEEKWNLEMLKKIKNIQNLDFIPDNEMIFHHYNDAVTIIEINGTDFNDIH